MRGAPRALADACGDGAVDRGALIERPADSVASMLHGIAARECNLAHLILLVPGERIELPTNGLQNRCSTAELTRHINDLAIHLLIHGYFATTNRPQRSSGECRFPFTVQKSGDTLWWLRVLPIALGCS
jgi:hypothetical protein